MTVNPRPPERGEVGVEELIGEVQYAIRGAAHIYARSHEVAGVVTVAAGPDADSMLDQIADLIAYSGDISPDANWADYLRHVSDRLGMLGAMERRSHVHNALIGLRSGQVLPIEHASSGALAPYVERYSGHYWLSFDPNVDQWPQPAATQAVAGQRAVAQAAEPAPATGVTQTGAFKIAGNSLHWWDENRPPVS